MTSVGTPWLEDLKRRVDLVDLGARYGVQWASRDGLPRARCPFHEEDTPSFVAYQEPRLGFPRYECFGDCGSTWDAIAFVRELAGLGFRDAVRELAGLVGMAVPTADALCDADGASERRAAERRRREEILDALEVAQRHFAQALQSNHPNVRRARAYLAERDLEPSVGDWGIGYALGTGELTQRLKEQGFSEALLHDAYLLRPGKVGHPPYEFQRHRLTFPLRNERGQVVADLGRAVPDAEGREPKPKHLNPGTIPGVYAKGETLFGLHEARSAIRKTEFAWIVEGQIDAVRMHLAGLTHTVALGGTPSPRRRRSSCSARERAR